MDKFRVCKNCGAEYPLDKDHFPYRRNENYASGTQFLYRCHDCQRAYNMAMKRKQRTRDKQKGINREFQ